MKYASVSSLVTVRCIQDCVRLFVCVVFVCVDLSFDVEYIYNMEIALPCVRPSGIVRPTLPRPTLNILSASLIGPMSLN